MTEPTDLDLAEEPDRRRALRAILPYGRAHLGLFVAGTAASLVATGALVAVPPVIGWATDAVTGGDRTGLLVAAGVLVGLAVVRLVGLRLAELWLATAGERMVRALRDTVVGRLAGAPLRFVERHRGGDLLNRATTELENLATFVRVYLSELLAAVGYLVLAVVTLLVYSPLLTLVLLVAFVPGALLVMRSFDRASGPAFAGEADAQAGLAATFTEGIEAAETLRMSGGTGFWAERARRGNAKLLAAIRTTVGALNRMPLLVAFEALTTAVLLALGGYLVAGGAIGLGVLVVFVLSTRNLFDSFLQLTGLVGTIAEATATAARLRDLLAVTQPPPAPPARDLPARGMLAAVGVTFGYGRDAPVLDAVSLTLAPGERVALVGPTGAGKTTLAKLLAGLYAPGSGTVEYAGVPLRDLDPAQVRRHLALVPQRVHLVAGTLLDNLLLVPGEPDRARVEAAVRDLGLDEWVAGLPAGLDTELGNRGERLSAGEQQLAGLVRAALVDPSVLILDEATADVDPVTAARLETAVDRICADRTLVVVAHRPETITRLRRAVRVGEGRVEDVAAEGVRS